MVTDREIIHLEIDVNTKAGRQKVTQFQKETNKQLKRVTKGVEDLGKVSRSVTDEAVGDTEDWIRSLGKVSGYYSSEIKEIQKLDSAIGHLKQQREKADKDAVKGIDDQIKALTTRMRKKKFEIMPFDMKAMGAEAKDGMDKAAKGFKGAMSSFFGRDLPGMLGGGGGLAKGLGKRLLGGIGEKGVQIRGRGVDLSKKAAAGRGGMASAVAGKSMKAMGGAMAKMGGMMGTLSKLGPIVGGVAAALMAVVKIMIDADAQAKKFQKGLLDSTSTAEFLGAAGGDSALAYEDLHDAVKSVRDAAFSWENLEWGISSEEHSAAMNALTQEGVALHRITQEAEVAKKSVQEFAAEVTHVGVAYSRIFGVSLQDVSKFQGEMMTDLGMGLEETKLAFAHMTRSATDSGIAANRFYSIIRGVSQDLSLYNVRMGSAVKLLGMLGKVMSPRNAGKFMQQATQGLRQMSQDDRLKLAIMTGDKGKKILDKDLKHRRQALYQRISDAIGEGTDEVRDQLTKNPKAVWDKVKEKAKGQLGTLREADLELKIDERSKERGMYGRAFAMENLGMGASLDILTAALAPHGGGTTLMEGAGRLGMTKMAEVTGVSTQHLRGLMKQEVAVKEQRDALLAQGQEELAAAQKIEDATERAAAEAAANAKIATAESGSTQDIIDSMSEEEISALKEEAKDQMDYAKDQGKMTQSLVDKLGVLVDFVMNQIYNAMIGIWDLIAKVAGKAGIGDPEERKRIERIKMARGAKGAAKTELVQVADKGGDLKRGMAGTALAGAMDLALKSAFDPGAFDARDRAKELSDKKAKTDPKNWTKKDEKALKNALSAVKKGEMGAKAFKGMKDSMFENLSNQQLQEALRMGGLSKEKFDTFGVQMSAGAMSPDQVAVRERAMKKAGITEEEIANALRNVPWLKDSDAALKTMAGMSPALEGTDFYEEAQKTAKETEAATKEGAVAVSHMDKEATRDGTLYVKFSSKFLKSDYKKTVHDAILDAMRTALFEYWMYSDLDREKVSGLMRDKGMSVGSFSGAFSEKLKTGKDLFRLEGGGTAEEGKAAVPRQHGGLVTHVRDGMAVVRPPPPGEGFTAIGPGEQIMPAYARGRGGGAGGATNVHITLDPNARQLIRAQVADGIYEYKQRERNT
jgi:hypothetical protein